MSDLKQFERERQKKRNDERQGVVFDRSYNLFDF